MRNVTFISLSTFELPPTSSLSAIDRPHTHMTELINCDLPIYEVNLQGNPPVLPEIAADVNAAPPTGQITESSLQPNVMNVAVPVAVHSVVTAPVLVNVVPPTCQIDVPHLPTFKKKVVTSKKSNMKHRERLLKERLRSFKKRIGDRLDKNRAIADEFVNATIADLKTYIEGMTVNVIHSINHYTFVDYYIVTFKFAKTVEIQWGKMHVVTTCYIKGRVLNNRFVVICIAVGDDHKTELIQGNYRSLLRLLSTVNCGVSQEIYNHIDDIFHYAKLVWNDLDILLNSRVVDMEPRLELMNGELVFRIIDLHIVFRKVDGNYTFLVGNNLDALGIVDNVFQAYEDYTLPFLYLE